MEDGKMRNLENVINNYKEFNKNEREQLQQIIHFDGLTDVKKRDIIREIVLEEGLGQDITAQEVQDNLNNKEMVKWLLDRLFVTDICNLAIDKFITKAKSGKININKFLNMHKEQPKRNYWQLISLNY
ncbi:phage-related protein [Clostridium tetani E88]|uniref:Phage-related protein n=2 Tax=Clostridium tetani TaxID=1513 RepID=Q894H9_CLOTE|nr:phage-related protein [Clostridium tetani E88]